METFFIQNFGCRASQADGAALQSELRDKGLCPAPDRTEADLVVLNTCTVTASADLDVRQTIRRVKRENPAARILVTGCYAQRAPEELAGLPGVEWVVGNSHKPRIVQILRAGGGDASFPTEDWGAEFHSQVYVGDMFALQSFDAQPALEAGVDRARPNLKIQDGCHNRCSFCVIPFVRGGNRWASADRVVEEVSGLASRYREVVLSGINLGRWGRSSGSEMRLVDLLRRILQETAIDRLRLSSVEPMDFSDELLDLMASTSRMAKHVHAPLQSGSDAILRAMHRKYRVRHYEDRVLWAHRRMPDAAIGADVMTGFPGETEALFEESRQFIERLPFSYLHVFTYSERPGTKAVGMSGAVPMEVRRERTKVLRELGERKAREFRDRLSGRTFSAVTLEKPRTALTTNFVTVTLGYDVASNQLVDVTI